MPSLFSHQHPIEKTYIKSRELGAAVNKLMRIRDQIGGSPIMYHCIESLNDRKRNLHTSVGIEYEWWSVCGTSSRMGTWKIGFCFRYFQAALRELDKNLASMDRQPGRKLVDDVVRAARDLGSAITRLGKAVQSGSVKVLEAHGRYPQVFARIRGAMLTLDKQAAEELTGPEVDSWCRWPRLDVDIPREVLRMAKLILLSKVPDQVFGLSVQSSAPGRPLKLMTTQTKFPTEEDLRVLGWQMGGPVKIYVVAFKPTWRRVWTFVPDDVGWWD